MSAMTIKNIILSFKINIALFIFGGEKKNPKTSNYSLVS